MKNKLIMDLALLNKDDNNLVISKKNGFRELYHYNINDRNKSIYKRSIGDYYVLKTLDKFHADKNLKKDLLQILKKLVSKYKAKKVLIIGLGNSNIACDSLGVRTTNKIIATNHYNDFLTLPKIALFNPEITEKTGINSFSLIKMVVDHLKPNCLIILDSLLTNNLSNLDSCIEINDGGIIPGIYLRDNRQIDKNTFNIPIISIGVTLAFEYNKQPLTSPDVNDMVEIYSKLIAECLNKIFLD